MHWIKNSKHNKSKHRSVGGKRFGVCYKLVCVYLQLKTKLCNILNVSHIPQAKQLV